MSRLKIAFVVSVILAVAVTFAVSRTQGQEKAVEKNAEKVEGEKAAKDTPEKTLVIKAAVGETAPDFVLTDTEGKQHRLSEYLKQDKRVVLEWFNPDCPFVKKHHLKTRSMSDTYQYAKENDVVWFAVNSGAPGKQGHGLKRNQKARADYAIAYPVLLDEDGTVGKLYGAKTTPHMFLIDTDGILIYAGAIDDIPNPRELGEVNFVRKALGECLAKKEVEKASTRSYGCSVKYAS